MKRSLIIFAWATLLLVSGCSTMEAPPDGGATESAGSDAATGLPPVSVLTIHRVADFEAWQAVFDEQAPSRARAGYLGHYTKRGIDDPDRVFVYSLGNDADALRAYLAGDELEATLRNAGVEDEPTHIVMRPMSRNLVSGRMLPGIIVVHDVEDYDRWRIEYDAFEEFRRRSGIIGHAVSRSLDAPDRVVVYHQANEVDDLRAFVESDELRDAMHEAGVVGEPDIHYIRVVGFADY